MSSGEINHDQSEPNAVAALLVLVIVFIALLAITFATYFYFNTSLTQELNIKEDTLTPSSLKSQRVYESEYLQTLKWQSKLNRTVHIPIDLAMKSVIKQYK
ncbi:hypothetical protein DID80_06080 [Candidatus Marinamargulisbacteria bacterium SCGC AAA071-K20]|nr:hypothetical protein DID80_06080 [Candidatus Marinamargulisbacteria bacterium SCGC AAA071-K20]